MLEIAKHAHEIAFSSESIASCRGSFSVLQKLLVVFLYGHTLLYNLPVSVFLYGSTVLYNFSGSGNFI